MAKDDQQAGRKKKNVVFIVEDDPFISNVYEMKFEKEGAETVIVSDGLKAKEHLSEDPPTVVLLDLMLPGASGFEVLEAMRQSEKWKDVPVFILSNLGQSEDIERGKKLGVIEYITKPQTKIQDVVDKVKKFFI